MFVPWCICDFRMKSPSLWDGRGQEAGTVRQGTPFVLCPARSVLTC